MSYIETISKTDATGTIKELYETAEATAGYIPNYLMLFSHRPEVFKAWENLKTGIRQNMSLRRYELVTLAAARKLEGSYCMIAHGDVLLNSGEVSEAQLVAIAHDYHNANLAPDEVAIMEFTEKIIGKSSSITQEDVDHLRGFGLSDPEILDITLAAAARSFFAKTIDALGAVPDAVYMNLAPELRQALTVGRAFEVPEKS